MRWLVVSPYLPHPRIGHGGGTAVLQLCRALARVHDTTLLCFRRENEDTLEDHLVGHGVRVETVPLRSEQATGVERTALLFDRTLCATRAMLRGRPMMAEKYDRAAMKRRLEELVDEIRPHAVQVEYSFLASAARHLRFRVDGPRPLWHNDAGPAEGERPHVLLNTHEIGTLPRLRRLARAATPWSRWRLGRELAIWAAHDRQMVDAADTVLCVTEQDRLLLRALSGSDAPVTVALGTDLEGVPTQRAQSPEPSLLFVGSFAHPPNVEGALWFCDAVLPRIWARRPDLVLEVVGRDAPDALHRRAVASNGRIRLLGFVDDLDEVFARTTLFVAPLLGGGGIKIKVLEAMARGAVVITTPVGAEGIDEHGEACALAGTEEEFAATVLHLLDAPDEQSALATRARSWIEQRFSWDAIVRELTRIVERGARN